MDHLAELARLEFSNAEREAIKKDLQRMIHFVDKLRELNTEGVEPLLHMSEETDQFRDDHVEGSCSREEALSGAPLTDGLYFQVPKVIRNPAE